MDSYCQKPYVIGEVGINHNGVEVNAINLCELTIKAGASAVKFQLFDADSLVSKSAEMADYQKKNVSNFETQHQMLSKNKISLHTLEKCRSICRDKNVDFICTAFDEISLETVIKLEPDFLKWPSGEIDNLPFLEIAACSNIPIIISTGMANQIEIAQAIDVCTTTGLLLSDIIIMHCTSEYPTPITSANINSVRFLKENFNTRVGYSDHTMGSLAAQLALAAGASFFEKHVTLSRLMEGVDHKASATLDEFSEYVKDLENANKILGVLGTECFNIEKKTKKVARKSIVALRDIGRGELFALDNITSMRPGTGISPAHIKNILNKKTKRDLVKGEMLSWDDIE